MVHVFISENDGDVHFSTVNCKAKELEECRELFRQNYLKFDSFSGDWTYPIRLAVLNIVSDLRSHDIETTISQDDVDVIKLSLYPPSNELKKVKFPIDKELLINHPPLKGVAPNEDYQLQAIRRFVTNNYLFMNIFPRLGKTYISSIGLASLMKVGQVNCIFGIMRPEGLCNFARELVFFSDGYIKDDDIMILDKDHRDMENYFNKKVILTSYNTWRLVCEYYKKIRKIKAKEPQKPFIKFDKWYDKPFLLGDECQGLAGDTLQYHYTQIHACYFPRICLMSGSIGYKYEKTYNLVKIMTPMRLSSMTKTEWFKYVTQVTNVKYNRDFIPERIKEYLDSVLKPLMISFGEDCLETSKMYEHVVYVDMNDKMKTLYRTTCDDFIYDIMQDSNGKVLCGKLKAKFPALRNITDDPSLLDIPNWNMGEDNAKVEILKSILEDRIDDKGKNVILWCNSPRTMKKLTEIFAKYNPICVNGNEQLCGVKRNERTDIIDEIKTNEKCRLLIANQVLSTSVSFWRFTVNIYWAVPIDPDYYAQSKRRICGDKSHQTSDVETIHLLYNRSIDNYLYENIVNQNTKKKYFDNMDDNAEISMQELKEILNPKHQYTIEGDEIY